MASSAKKQTIIGLVVSLACLGWFLRKVDFDRLWDLALNMNPVWALLTLAFLGLSMVFRTLRWRILLSPMGDYGFKGLFSANLIGFMANNVLPARLGEFVRAYAANKVVGAPAAGALGSIVVERVFDGLTLCLALFITLMFVDPQAQAGSFNIIYLRGAGFSLLALFAGVLLVVIGLIIWPGKMVSICTGIAQKISAKLGLWVGEFLVSFSQGLMSLKRGRNLLWIVLHSLLTWIMVLIMSTVFLPAVGLEMLLLLGALALVGENLAAAVPAAPGFVGTFQLAVFWALSLGGAPKDPALAYAVLFWAVCYFGITGAGLFEMWRKGMSLGSLREKGSALSGEQD